MKKNDIPAFPCEGEGFGMPEHFQEGMTLRDYFAGQALAALCASPFLKLDKGEIRWEEVAKQSYRYADAMLAEREKGE
jgi:hypothetical protein